MTIRNILTEPDLFLRQKSKDVDIVDDATRTLMDDMLDTMYAAPGIGLAAIQVGIPKRIIVIDLSKEEEKKPLYFVNPKIILTSKNLFSSTSDEHIEITRHYYRGAESL